jgi:YVTN family beta-propeller protein
MGSCIQIRKLGWLVLFFVLMASTAFAVDGRWTFSNMHPVDGLYSKIYGIEGGQKVGVVGIPSDSADYKDAPALWKGDTPEWVNLQKTGIPSIAYAISAGQQVGSVSQFAWLWDGGGTDGDVLQQPEKGLYENGIYVASVALGVSHGWQAGEAMEVNAFDMYNRAVLWHGASERPTLLHYGPAESSSSVQGIYGASANSPGFQVGYAVVFDGEADWNVHATLWNGSAGSHVDMNPTGARESVAFAGYGSRQVGYAKFAGKDQAVLWSGSATSYVNLNPASADASYARSIYGNYQVGYVISEFFSHAWLWEGSADKYVDLHELLPPEYISSFAEGIEVVDGHIYVVGSAYNYATRREEAIIWHRTPFGPMIWANGQSGKIDVEPKQGFSISVAFEAGQIEGVGMDWWFIAYDHQANKWYYLDEKGKWNTADEFGACRPFYSGPSLDIKPTVVLSNVVLPPGLYMVSFGVSFASTDILEGGILLDSVDINVKQSAATKIVAYVANGGSNTVSVIDTSNNTITAAIPVGKNPKAVAFSPTANIAYVTNYGENTVSVIDVTNNTVITTITVGNGPSAVAFNPAGDIAYITNFGTLATSENTVSVIDTHTHTVKATITVGDRPTGIAFHPTANIAYAINYRDEPGTVSVIDTSTNMVLSSITVEFKPEAVAFHPTANIAYVTNYQSDRVSVIDTSNNTVTAKIGSGYLYKPYGVAFHPTANIAYVVNFGSATVSVINTADNSNSATIALGGGGATMSYGVAFHPAANIAYVTNYGIGTVSVIDTVNNTVTATISVGDSPMEIAFGAIHG